MNNVDDDETFFATFDKDVVENLERVRQNIVKVETMHKKILSANNVDESLEQAAWSKNSDDIKNWKVEGWIWTCRTPKKWVRDSELASKLGQIFIAHICQPLASPCIFSIREFKLRWVRNQIKQTFKDYFFFSLGVRMSSTSELYDGQNTISLYWCTPRVFFIQVENQFSVQPDSTNS